MPTLAEISIISLIQNRTISPPGAALLWAVAARRGSLIVASPPRLAGKSTVLHAVLDLFPLDTTIVPIDGERATFDFIGRTDPAKTTLLVHEFSDHLAEYTWGEQAARVFVAATQGYAIGATMHAATAEQVLHELASPPNAIHPQRLGLLQLVVTIAVRDAHPQPIRRVQTVTVVHPPSLPNKLPGLHSIAVLDDQADELRLDLSTPSLALLAARLGGAPDALRAEMERRTSFLSEMSSKGEVNPPTARQHLGGAPLTLAG